MFEKLMLFFTVFSFCSICISYALDRRTGFFYLDSRRIVLAIFIISFILLSVVHFSHLFKILLMTILMT